MINISLYFLFILLIAFCFCGVPLYYNFYGANSSTAFIKIIYWINILFRFVCEYICFICVFVVARCVLYLMGCIFQEGYFGKLLRILNLSLSGISLIAYTASLFYSFVMCIWVCISLDSKDFLNFPISIAGAWFIGHIVEIVRLYLMSFTKKLDTKLSKLFRISNSIFLIFIIIWISRCA